MRKSLLVCLAIFGCVGAHAAELTSREPCTTSEAPDLQRYLARQRATVESEQKAARAQRLPVRSIDDLARVAPTNDDYLARNRPGIRCERITYRVDGLAIKGFLWYPGDVRAEAKLPLIVFNRGGTGEDSKLRPNTQFGFERFVRAGYVVIGSQYRGNNGSEGKDELGGADVADVLELVKIGRTLPNVDADNVYALGYSRGAMMTLSAVRDGARFNAVALVGLPADLRSRGDRPAADLAHRSAITFVDRLDVPMLLLQGSGDPLVSTAENTLPFASALQRQTKTYELVVYDGDTHGIVFNAEDKDRRILEWFRRHAR